jgi:acyl-CoA dehydrogenase
MDDPAMARWLQRRLQARGLVPRMSESERIALAAGDVWVDGDLFSGHPRLAGLLDEPYPELSPAEVAFLEGPVEELCAMVDDWRLWRERQLPRIVWNHLREHGFFGLAIPPDYGGLGFSALGQSTVFGKLTSRSLALSALVVIPNSVGPAELLLEYGTEAQKQQLLPRLARGEEIPCFALTEPEAGSDAAALESEGVVFRGAGDELLLRLNWGKRYITLAPVATLLGLAFRLRDPENLLGRGAEPGLTCALVPTTLPGVEIGRRHDPLGVPFPNGPTAGSDVVVPVDAIIGGTAGAGQGWKMLMETLAGGRAVSLPAQAVAGAKATARAVGAYAVVRRQFGQPIARFDGVREPLARLAGRAYAMEAARIFTCGAVDAGRRPAVVSAMVKYRLTELARQVVNDGMDVLGGAGICLGPRNLLGQGYIAAPIGITVEGANILHRTLVVFGQGALRCSPWAGRLLAAAAEGRVGRLLAALGGQLSHLAAGALRAVWLGLSRGRLVHAEGGLAPYGRRLVWASTLFAALADWALLRLGGRLKSHGALNGRFADALSWNYVALATLRRYRAEGERPDDLAVASWALEECLRRVQEALEGILANFPGALLGALLRGPCRWWLRLSPLGKPPTDQLGDEAAEAILEPGARRDRLTAWSWVGTSGALADLEEAFVLAVGTRPIVERLQRAVRDGALPSGRPLSMIQEAVTAGLLTAEEGAVLHDAEAARKRSIEADSFSLQEYLGRFAPAQDESPPRTVSAG